MGYGEIFRNLSNPAMSGCVPPVFEATWESVRFLHTLSFN